MNQLKQLIEKSRKTPALAPIYALELDRHLRGMAKTPLTFSAIGLADGAAETAHAMGLDKLFGTQPTQQAGGTIYQAEMLAKEGKRTEAIAHAFANAHGAEVNALNLFYANHATTNSKLRIHFLNKYLAAFGMEIELEEGKEKDFFHKIRSAQTHAQVDGPLVTVIMPAYNAEGTIELAVRSLLNQTWKNLQIIVVDDASTDDTLQIAKELAKNDPRVEVLSNPVNAGPYICRNLGVLHTRGQWLTVHDADDWAFPGRIEQQVNAMTSLKALACTGRMLRVNGQGQITRPTRGGSYEEDGYLRTCFVSLMVQTAYFHTELGGWDSVRVGGDAELIARIAALGTKATHLAHPLMLCLDHDACLTNHQELGLADETGETQPIRVEYKKAYTAWHKSAGPKKVLAFGKSRPFETPEANLIDQDAVRTAFAACAQNLALIKASELFDEKRDRSPYPEVEQTGMGPAKQHLPFSTAGVTDQIHENNSRLTPLKRSFNATQSNRKKDNCTLPEPIETAKTSVPTTYKAGKIQEGTLVAAPPSPGRIDTNHINKANSALNEGDESGWQGHLNAYLSQFSAPPLYLDAGHESVFDRLSSDSPPPVPVGPLITVIMPAWNAEKTIRKAVRSILNQTWRNLELLIVDDASLDSTWDVLQEISSSDSRVKIYRNKTNVGPYVSKNMALTYAQGDWITGHDSDDFALPNRLECHLSRMIADGALVSTAAKLRILESGIVKMGPANEGSDGVVGQAFISCLYAADYLKKHLGGWDSVRFGADGEIINRAKMFCGERFKYYSDIISMVCLDLPDSLTNNQIFGITQSGLSAPRKLYLENYKRWHRTLTIDNYFMPFPLGKRPFTSHESAEVPIHKVAENIHFLITGGLK